MNQETLEGYDRSIVRTFAEEDDALRAAREEMKREGLPGINVSAGEGKPRHVLALISGAGRILEVGTLGGSGPVRLARALPPEGRMVPVKRENR